MAEISEMMLDGTLCGGCGVYLDQEPVGYPIYCSPECESDYGPDAERTTTGHHRKPKQKCPICGARKANVAEHAKAKHPEELSRTNTDGKGWNRVR